jgi:hypothetical protein
MIITLTGADFSQKNINAYLTSWSISRVLGTGANYNGPATVEKGAALSATVVLDEGYELGSAGVTVTVGSETLSGVATVNGNTITISISSVTGNVVIKVPTAKIVTGDGGSDEGDNGGSDNTSLYTLVHGNQYVAAHLDNTARATISPYTITVPKGVTITNKPNIKWAYYTGVTVNNMPSGSGNGAWGDYTYTGTGAAIGISFKKTDDTVFDWDVDSKNPADYFDVSDEGLWNGTASGVETPETPPATPEGALGDITALTLVNGNPYGTAEQQIAANRVHSETALYAPAGTVIACKDTTTYKWALKKVTSETDLTGVEPSYRPDSVWTTKTSYTTEQNGYWCFILLKASDANFDWSVDSKKVSDYFTVT